MPKPNGITPNAERELQIAVYCSLLAVRRVSTTIGSIYLTRLCLYSVCMHTLRK